MEAIQDLYSGRQEGTQEILEKLMRIIEDENKRKAEQTQKGFDGLTFFIYKMLIDKKFKDSDTIAGKIKDAFQTHSNWKESEKESRELRQDVTLLLMSEKEIEDVVPIVEHIFNVLKRVKEISQTVQ